MKPTASKVAGVTGLAAVAVGGALVMMQSAPKCTDGNVVCLNWSASPNWSDNSPYGADAQPAYNVYRVAKTYPNPSTRTLVATTSALSTTLTKEPRGETCWSVSTTAVDPKTQIRVEGNPSNLVCKFVRLAAPTDGAIEAPTDGAIEPRN